MILSDHAPLKSPSEEVVIRIACKSCACSHPHRGPRAANNTKKTPDDIRIWAAQKEIASPARNRTDHGREGMEAAYVDGAPVNLWICVLRLGKIAFTSVNGEAYNEISQRLKRESHFAETVMVTLANGAADSGYIPDDVSLSHKTFRVPSPRLKPGRAEGRIVNTAAGPHDGSVTEIAATHLLPQRPGPRPLSSPKPRNSSSTMRQSRTFISRRRTPTATALYSFDVPTSLPPGIYSPPPVTP